MNKRRYLIDDSAFDKPSKETAYWIGFLFADGYMNFRQADIKINLAEKDAAHLFKLRQFLKSNYRIFKYSGMRAGKRHAGRRMDFRSRSIAIRLKQLGWKSKSNHRPIRSLTNSVDFWRGVVDGDGHLGITNGKPRFTLVGRRNIVASFLRFAKKRLPTLEANISDHGSIYAVQSAGRPAQAIIKLLYHGSEVHLDRKKTLAEGIIPLPLPDRTAKPRRKHIDETVFNRITNESAYWIGYMFYSSYIGQRIGGQTPIEIHVGLKKQYHLEGLRDFLNSDHSIQTNNASVRFSFRSDAIASALAGYGIIPGRKNRQIPTELKFNENFCRGVADGKNKRIRKNMAGS